MSIHCAICEEFFSREEVVECCEGCIATLRQQLARQVELMVALETANAFVVGWLMSPNALRADFPEDRFRQYLGKIAAARARLTEVEGKDA